jgi:hypothetical protein
MNHDRDPFDEHRRHEEASDWPAEPPVRVPPRRLPADASDLRAIAESEGWSAPPPEVARVPLRPWQQAVFWGLQVYIVVMLGVMVVGFAHVAAGR